MEYIHICLYDHSQKRPTFTLVNVLRDFINIYVLCCGNLHPKEVILTITTFSRNLMNVKGTRCIVHGTVLHHNCIHKRRIILLMKLLYVNLSKMAACQDKQMSNS